MSAEKKSRLGSRAGTPWKTPRRGLVTSSPEDTDYRERTDQVTRVQRLFKGYGSAVASYILAQSLTRGGIARIALKLGLTPRNMEDADLTQVYLWLQRNGAEEFCRIVGIRMAGETTEVRESTRDGGGTQLTDNRSATMIVNEPQDGTQIMKDTESTMIQPDRSASSSAGSSRAPQSDARVSSSARNRSGASDIERKPSDGSTDGGTNPVRKVGLKPVGLDNRDLQDFTETETGVRPVKLRPEASKAPEKPTHPAPPEQEASGANPLKPKPIPRDLHRPKAPPPSRSGTGRATGTGGRRIVPPTEETSAAEYLRKMLEDERS